jgi:8-oxo-dGTP diphosphatase
MRPGVGVGVFVRNGNKVLVHRRKNAHGNDTWGLIGGHMEFGETPEQTAAREAHEEANITIKNARVIGITNDVMHAEQKHYITIFVEADFVSGDLKTNDADHIAELQWCDADKIPEPRFAPLQRFLENKRML